MFVDRTNQRDHRAPYGDQKRKHRERKPDAQSVPADDDIVELSIAATELETAPAVDAGAADAPTAHESSPAPDGAEPPRKITVDIEV